MIRNFPSKMNPPSGLHSASPAQTLESQDFVERNPATPTGLHNLLSHPYSMATFCTSSLPGHSQSRNRLTGAVPSGRRNAKMIERQRRGEMKTLYSELRSLLPDENLRVLISIMCLGFLALLALEISTVLCIFELIFFWIHFNLDI